MHVHVVGRRALELRAGVVLGTEPWDTRLHAEILSDVGQWHRERRSTALCALPGKFRKYDHFSLRDLLRFIRYSPSIRGAIMVNSNKRSHYGDLSSSSQAILGLTTSGLHGYFASRFPALLMVAAAFACMHDDWQVAYSAMALLVVDRRRWTHDAKYTLVKREDADADADAGARDDSERKDCEPSGVELLARRMHAAYFGVGEERLHSLAAPMRVPARPWTPPLATWITGTAPALCCAQKNV